LEGHLHQVPHIGEVVGDGRAERRLTGHYRELLRVRLPLVSGLLAFFFSPRARRIGSSSGSTSRWLSSTSSSPGANGSLMSTSSSGSCRAAAFVADARRGLRLRPAFA